MTPADTLVPPAAIALLTRAGQLRGDNDLTGAVALAREAAGLAPALPAAHFQLGLLLAASGQPADAVAAFQAAQALQPTDPWIAYEHGNALFASGRWDAALAQFDQAIALMPECAPAWTGRGQVLSQRMRFREAVESLERAVALAPDTAPAHWNLALCALLLGDYALGWAEYEWRWKSPELGARPRQFDRPRWMPGTPLAGRTLLLHAEQGYGDTLQFARYALMARDAGARVVLEVAPPLVRLLARSLPGVSVVAYGSALPPFDLHCPLLSAPLAFGTRVETIPWPGPYLAPAAERVAHWGRRLGEHRPRVGIAWSGSRNHGRDADRSLPLAALLAHLPRGPHYIVLQRDLRAGDAELLRTREDVLAVCAELSDFDETAALVSNVDSVFSVDTSVAHLAGALGKPVAVLTSAWPDWRWLLGREDTPWYPTARLYRQAVRGVWDDVLQRVRADLSSPAS